MEVERWMLDVEKRLTSLRRVESITVRISKTKRRHVARAEAALDHVRRMLSVGNCHPSWGQKRAARIEKFIEQKQKRIHKKRMSK